MTQKTDEIAELEQQIATKRAALEANGGRGVDLAEEIDALERQLSRLKNPPQFKNPYRTSVKQWREDNDLQDEEAYTEALGGYVADSICPAMCTEGCNVEPDGKCSHGCPSLLLAAGLC